MPQQALSRAISPVSKDAGADQDIDGLLSGSAWSDLDPRDQVYTLTYSFPNSPADYGKGYSEATHGFEAFNTFQQSAVKAILASISALTGLSFEQVTGQQDASALIRFAESDKPFEAYSFYPSETDNGGDAWFNHSRGLYDAPKIGDEAYATFMHEIGHTLALKHSFENAGFGRVPAEHDSLEYTVMSYSSYVGANDWLSGPQDFPQTFMMDDIAALQFMYGAD